MNTDGLLTKKNLIIAAILIIGVILLALGFSTGKIFIGVSSPNLKMNSIEISADKKSILSSETKEVVFTTADAQKYMNDSGNANNSGASQTSGAKTASNCFLDASISNSKDQIIFSTGCSAEDLSQVWIGIYNLSQNSVSGANSFNFLVNGSGSNFIWSADDKTITYEANLGLSGTAETRTIELSSKEVIEKKNTLIINNWKTYSNEQYGFMFKYPGAWSVEEYHKIIISDGKAGVTELKINNISNADVWGKWAEKIKSNLLDGWTVTREYDEIELINGKKTIDIAIDKNSNNYSLENWPKDLDSKLTLNWGKEFLVNKEKGLLGGYGCCMNYRQTFFVLKNNNFYSISGGSMNFDIQPYGSSYDYQDEYSQVLSTFKFINKDLSFSCGTSSVTDVDNNNYGTVQIGNQCWMKENLKVTKNPDGKAIVRYCYGSDPKNCSTGGGLYDWNTAMNGSALEGAQGICSEGWHVPKDSEWDALENSIARNLQTQSGQACSDTRIDKKCAAAGIELRPAGSSGFETIFAGERSPSDLFSGQGQNGYLWSSSKIFYKLKEGGAGIWYRFLNATDPKVSPNLLDLSSNYSFSVRCIKD